MVVLRRGQNESTLCLSMKAKVPRFLNLKPKSSFSRPLSRIVRRLDRKKQKNSAKMKTLLCLAFILFANQTFGGVLPQQNHFRVKRTIDANSTKEIFEDLSKILQVRTYFKGNYYFSRLLSVVIHFF